jgi:hypothetical protein
MVAELDGATRSWSTSGSSRRRLRHRDLRTLTAVRTTHAAGAGWRLTFRRSAQARANASATCSSSSSMSPVLGLCLRPKQSSPFDNRSRPRAALRCSGSGYRAKERCDAGSTVSTSGCKSQADGAPC